MGVPPSATEPGKVWVTQFVLPEQLMVEVSFCLLVTYTKTAWEVTNSTVVSTNYLFPTGELVCPV